MAGLGQNIELKLTTKLSPQQILLVKMLELPSMDLQQRITEELQENPMLEEGKSSEELDHQEEEKSIYELDAEDDDYTHSTDDPLRNEDFDYDTYVSDDEVPDYRMRTNNTSADDDTYDGSNTSLGTTFHDYMLEQIGMLPLSERERQVAEYVVGNIDDVGYLRRSVESLVDDLAFAGVEISDERMAEIVHLVQTFDPPGVGAIDLQECLLLQLRRKVPTEQIELAKTILVRCFEDYSHHRLERVRNRLSLTETQMKGAVDEILKLNPKPGYAYADDVLDTQKVHIIPDFRVENHNGELVVSLNMGDLPDLHVSEEYQEQYRMFASRKSLSADEKQARTFIKQRLDSAKWFIDAIRQRNETLLRTMTAIVEFQKEFFYEGDDTYLKPMILMDIASVTGYDISTISRVGNSKYVQTEFGVYPLKHFFSEAMTNTEGEEVSTKEIKKVLREVISKEDSRHPLRDEQLSKILEEHGYPIARRTVAKYREQLGLPVARLRKRI